MVKLPPPRGRCAPGDGVRGRSDARPGGAPPAWLRACRDATRIVLAATAIVLSLAAAGAADGDVRVVTELRAPASWQTYSNGINRHGEICGFRSDGDAPGRAIVWRSPDAEAEVLPVLSESEPSWSCVLNDRGQIPGRTDGRAVIWNRDGTIVDLTERLPDFSYSEAWVVNRRGAVAGVGVPVGQSVARAIYWPRRGPAIVLPFDETLYLSTYAYAMNSRNVVAGVASLLPAGRPLHAVYWTRRRALVDLHPFLAEAMPTAVASAAQEVFDDGRIAGIAWEPITTDVMVQKPWVFDPRRKTVDLIDSGGFDVVTAWASSGRRYLVGYLNGDWLFDPYAIGTQRPALWIRSGSGRRVRWNLADLPVPPGLSGLALWSVNRRGAIVGVGEDADGRQRAYYVAPETRSHRAR